MESVRLPGPFRIGYETFDGYWTRRGFPDVKADFSHANGLVYDESDAVEYSLDEKDRVARQVWVSEQQPPPSEWAYSIAMGDVDYLPKTGNILVHYGFLMPRTEAARKSRDGLGTNMEWTRIREYTHTSQPEILWELVLGDPAGRTRTGWHVYGGERIPSFTPATK